MKRKGTCVILKNLETGKKLCRNISHVKKINNIPNDKDVVDCYDQDDNGDFDANEPEDMTDDGNTQDDNVEIHEVDHSALDVFHSGLMIMNYML